MLFIEHIFPLNIVPSSLSSSPSFNYSFSFPTSSTPTSFPYDPDLDHTIPLSPLVDADHLQASNAASDSQNLFSIDSSSDPSGGIRRSTRQKHIPPHLHDYDCSTNLVTYPHSLEKVFPMISYLQIINLL